ncbi:putative protein kinase RLK-Pelle-DLSV family [Helianthus annuus]|nr:putative protein kinase RLK-Pelle-DLSV family [Helianthus annuus]KAJ0470461.1 putative protein kinase RLK-Pelle-DLSV family [Helianthus annuus]KAJ0487190.1 putative protein kinase RLK-Pelle-DLSV family [Helianthus annuus]KAJ0855473.1 putative protein kinase RLK-Pelle-DLSV family [Helianthus annuus]
MIWFYCTCALLFILKTSSAVDTLLPNQTLKDGDTIVSANEFFELGFFSRYRNVRYLGIWFKKVDKGTVVWVANRDVLLAGFMGMLKFTDKGTLQLFSGNNTLIWSSQPSKTIANINPVAQLLDTGNLVIRDNVTGDFIWQSFDHPGNTWLPGMKIGVDLVTGIQRNLTSWKSRGDPSPGSYTVSMDINGFPQLYIANMKDKSRWHRRVGSANGVGFTGMRGQGQSGFYEFETVYKTREEIYINFTSLINSSFSRMMLNYQGNFRQFVLNSSKWEEYITPFQDECEIYGVCGAYGSCNINNSPVCTCLEGFEPKVPKEWSANDWSNGCKHEIPMNNETGYNFSKFSNLKLPDSRDTWFNSTMSLGECEKVCTGNVSCTAYANTDIRDGGSGCLMWFSELVDMRDAPQGDDSGQDIYIKMANPTFDKKKTHLKVTFPVVFVVVLITLGLILYAWKKKKNSHDICEDLELPLFSLDKIAKATGNFSINNKLGQGGFGEVYKGVLEEGGEIAVKRLSKTSRQGLVEFQNEAMCIAKLQHRNLVKLLGYCAHGDEMMLIYEYMPNKSLDYLLFDENNSSLLDWPRRNHIINGIARGLLYLHQDSVLRIIHRDLKASNILLDSNMNAKISDFGLARMFKEYETEANTNKVVGTLGYISPEYAANGNFSAKSDVFSFGVLVLEIVSGKKNRGFTHQGHHDNLLGHAWRLYKEARPLELVDAALGDSWTASEVLQAIHVGLSCVQHHAYDRPNMSSVVHMLGGDGALPVPNQPGYYAELTKHEVESTSSMLLLLGSVNDFTITQLDAR